jgi:hypothetical protein
LSGGTNTAHRTTSESHSARAGSCAATFLAPANSTIAFCKQKGVPEEIKNYFSGIPVTCDCERVLSWYSPRKWEAGLSFLSPVPVFYCNKRDVLGDPMRQTFSAIDFFKNPLQVKWLSFLVFQLYGNLTLLFFPSMPT